MEINTSKSDDVLIVDLSGKFDFASASPVEEKLTKLLDDGASRVLLDLANVPYVSSSGLRVFLKLAQRLKRDGGQLRICGPNDTIREVFEISGFDRILNIHDDCQQAMEAFSDL